MRLDLFEERILHAPKGIVQNYILENLKEYLANNEYHHAFDAMAFTAWIFG